MIEERGSDLIEFIQNNQRDISIWLRTIEKCGIDWDEDAEKIERFFTLIRRIKK